MRLVILLAITVCCSCANDLRVDHPFDGQTNSGPLVTAELLDRGAKKLHIDATNKMSQVYVDLDEGREMKVDEAFSTNGWDLSFKRYEISNNGGSANPNGVVEVAIVKGGDYDALAQAPGNGFALDLGTRLSEVGGADAWFTYNLSAHGVVTRSDVFYVIKSSAGAYFKLKMLDYYDGAGTPASITLEYAPLTEP